MPKGYFTDDGLVRATGGRRDPIARDATRIAAWLCNAPGEQPPRQPGDRYGVTESKAKSQPSRVSPDVREELAGPTYSMIPSDQDHSGDPASRLYPPHGVPRDLPPAHIDILPSAERVLPVSQSVEHGPEQSRSEEFDEAEQAALNDMAVRARFFDRRYVGRKYRSGPATDPETFRPYPKDPEVDWSRGY